MNKTVSILGATGSVGIQALSVAKERGYKVSFLSGNRNVTEMERAARAHKPSAVAMANEAAATDLRCRLSDTDIKVLSGEEGILAGIPEYGADIVLNAILGKAGLQPTLVAIECGIPLALANKESLVIAGDIVIPLAKSRGVDIIPVDSEHSAIFQSIKCGRNEEVKKIILTASGGPFFGKSKEELRSVTLEQTLAHPTWKMGKKITVDSATLMNKGFEIIEASHLFGIPEERVEVLIHRESILHSAVEFLDNMIVGEMSLPDMRACIQYAIDYPCRVCGAQGSLDLASLGSLTFARPDTAAFPLLDLSRRALHDGGASGAVLNAADEVAVEAFLSGKISFSAISDVISSAYEKLGEAKWAKALPEILSFDTEARLIAEREISKLSVKC